MSVPDVAVPEQVLASAEMALSKRFAAPVHLGDPQPLGNEGKGTVVRVKVVDGPSQLPATLVMKLADARGEFDPTDRDPLGPAALLWNEWAGSAFLTSLPGGSPGTPAFFGGDRTAGFVLLEDLGDGASLASALLGDDPQAGEQALAGYVDALARIHTATFGLADEYTRLRQRLGPVERTLEQPARSLGRIVKAGRKLVDTLALPEGTPEALRWLDQRLFGSAGRPFQAYSPNDCCPDNNRLYADGSVRLFDLEHGGFRHACLDVAYLHTTFPTCWCVRRLPQHMPARMVDRWRQAVGERCPEALDDDVFIPALLAARAFWAIDSASYELTQAVGDDGDRTSQWRGFTIASHRQLARFRLDQLAEVASLQPELAPLGELADWVRSATTVWGRLEPLPPYPAFADQR